MRHCMRPVFNHLGSRQNQLLWKKMKPTKLHQTRRATSLRIADLHSGRYWREPVSFPNRDSPRFWEIFLRYISHEHGLYNQVLTLIADPINAQCELMWIRSLVNEPKLPILLRVTMVLRINSHESIRIMRLCWNPSKVWDIHYSLKVLQRVTWCIVCILQTSLRNNSVETEIAIDSALTWAPAYRCCA